MKLPIETTSRPPRPWLLLGAVLLVIGSAYSNAIAGPFVWDDLPLIVRQPLVHRFAVTELLTQVFWSRSPTAEALATYYRPLTSLTYALDWWRSGGRPGAFHLSNIALHLGVCALVFALSRRAGARPAVAALATVTFGLMPRLTENVAWISGRTDLLAALGALIYLYEHFSCERRGWKTALAATALFLGLLAKEVALAAFAGVLLAEVARWRAGGRLRSVAARMGPGACAVIVYLALRWGALRHADAAQLPPFDHRWLMPIQALGDYAWMTLDLLRPRLQIGTLGVLEIPMVLLGAVTGACVALVAARMCTHGAEPLTWALVGCGLAALLLVVHLIPIRLNVVAADRFLYLPYAAIAPLLGRAAMSLDLRRTRLLYAGWAGLVVVLFFATMQRNEDWADDIRLWRRAVATEPSGDYLPQNELGNALAAAGEQEEAVAVYRSVVHLVERSIVREGIVGNIAVSLSDLGRFEEAEPLLESLVRQSPLRAGHFYNLALNRARMFRFDEAEKAARRALQLQPGYLEAELMLQHLPELREMAQTLPAETPNEPVSVLARRAGLWTRLSVPPLARAAYIRMLRAPDASDEQLARAAAYLVTHGTATEGKVALDTLSARNSSLVLTMREVLQDRFGSSAVP